MDVPFHSSGAISRVHYTLVRNVESVASDSVADGLLFAAIDSARDKLANPRLSSVNNIYSLWIFEHVRLVLIHDRKLAKKR
jgi:hypothetical protein